MARGDPYGFGLRSKCPTSRQPWDERQLHGRYHFNAVGCDDEQLCMVGVDRCECRLIGSEVARFTGSFASPAERVVEASEELLLPEQSLGREEAQFGLRSLGTESVAAMSQEGLA